MAQAREILTREQRRQRREERRAKQRVANVGRAERMGLAREAILSIAEARKAAPRSTRQPARRPEGPQLFIGCSGWFYWHWREIFYPRELPTRDWFTHYAGQFQTVELNAPFYSWPTVAAVQAWTRQAGRRRMVYTVKVCELITHVKRFSRTQRLVSDFGLIADLLGPRMGCFLFQLPPSFHYSPARLKRVVAQLDPRHRNVLEFRHKSWWNERVYAAMRERGIIFCSCSGPRLPDELVKTADDIYVRFHGLKQWYRHDYSDAELQVWADRIRQSGAARAWIYFNNDREGHAIRNARSLQKLLS